VASPAPGLDQLPALLEAIELGGVGAELSAEGDVRPLPPAVELAAYRIIQESLTHVVRHGGGAPARVKLVYRPDSLTVGIYNDGGPVPTPPVEPGTGNGISGMRERAAAFGGELEAGPRPSGGFRVVARIPLQTADQSTT
ncbi:MAG: sensor histidine kinase, partial [Acidimicrobiales bacterium]